MIKKYHHTKPRPFNAQSVRTTCSSGKIAYPNRTEALLAVARIKSRDFWWKNTTYTAPIRRAYQCPECQLWHLTSQLKTRKEDAFKNSGRSNKNT